MQGAETEAEGSIHRYVTEAEWRKQRRRWPIMTHRLYIRNYRPDGIHILKKISRRNEAYLSEL